MSQMLLEGGETVAFADIDTALGRAREKAGRAGSPGRALVATIVAVGPDDRLAEAIEPIQALGQSGAIRGIVIPHHDGEEGEFSARVHENVVVLDAIREAFVDNAVAALRLSSLPTVIWWRGGDTKTLEGLVRLSDRMVLDADPPDPAWRAAVPQFDRTAFSDLRWTRLTRWRALMAQFFDMDDVRNAAERFTHLSVCGSDASAARLFAAWLRTTLPGGERIEASFEPGEGLDPIERIVLDGGQDELVLEVAGASTCVAASARLRGHDASSRVVSLGGQKLTTLLSEELTIRSRDAAFERALAAVVEAS